ncbi:hypothetical protein D7Z26_07125 [Cohnella endophytica]|uniref:SLH domain-containing protein n=1 Tax=Cohnella endophytica TaxID=2419778 RepID=A0A494XWL8_9BACL|nr:S-layer homology domain-containing protein [Cohnella endophytica]RKP54997.1 hypothetical protein D7Z26_07125 [Cohnella endophytica]
MQDPILSVLKVQFGVETPENATKPDSLKGNSAASKNVADLSFTETDAEIQSAIDNDLEIHGHTLVWESQSIPWLNNYFLSLLVRLLELKGNDASVTTFSDVDSSAYYYDAVKIAAQLGIIQGTGSNLFDPNSKISRQDMMVIAARAAKAAGKALPTGGTLGAFSDETSEASYAKDSVAALVNAGIVQVSNGKLATNRLPHSRRIGSYPATDLE